VIYRDAVERLSLRQLRAQFKPREFSRLQQVHVEAAGTAATIKIARVASPTAFGMSRRWMVCPACGRQTSVVGLVTDGNGGSRWCCFRCGSWRSRRRIKTQRSER
jgi:transposase-like protein